MPACKVGCCPDNICECTDCECLLNEDGEFTSGSLGYENSFLFAEHDLKASPPGTRLKVCPCRTKEELTEYVKPIEPRFDDSDTEHAPSEGRKDDRKDTCGDDCCRDGVCKKDRSKGDESGTHAPHSHCKEVCCDDESCTKAAAEKDRGSAQGEGNADAHPPGHQHASAESCCKDKTCGGGGLGAQQRPKKRDAGSCCDDKSCGEKSSGVDTHKHSKHHGGSCCDDKSCGEKSSGVDTHKHSSGGSCCDDKSCGVKVSGVDTHKHSSGGSCCDDKSCGEKSSGVDTHKHSKHHGGSCCDDKSCGEKSSGVETHKHSKHHGGSCCDDKSCGEKSSGVETHKHSSGGSCCDDKSCGVKVSQEETHKHSSGGSCCDDKSCGDKSSGVDTHKHSSGGSCCDDKSCGVKVSQEETHKHSSGGSCCDDKSCGDKSHGEDTHKQSRSCEKSCCQEKKLPRQSSLPTRPSSNQNSPSKVSKAPNFEIRGNFNLAEQTPTPYRKTKRSQSLAEARLGSLLSERRPSCFQLSPADSHAGHLPDPHHGHHHHHAHEYHHAKPGHHDDHDHHHDDHDHHHDDHDHHHDDHDHHHGNCCQGSNLLQVDAGGERKSCCEDASCEGRDASPSCDEDLKPLVKSDEAKLNIEEMILQTTKLRVQNMCCPKESQIVHDELRKLEGIENIRVNVIGRVVHVSHYPELVSPTTLMTILNKRHLGVSIVDTGSEEEMEKGLPRALKLRLVNLAVQAVLLAVALGATFTDNSWYMWVAIVEICFGIYPVLKKVYYAVRNLEVDLNILITITVIGTLAIQEWVEGAAVVFVFTLAGFLQRYCFYRVQKTISGLMLSKPSKAVMACTGECIPIEKVPIGKNN